MTKRKKVVVLADLHCGHRVGLCPPKYRYITPDKYTPIREELWELYTEMIERQKPIDILLVNGDVIDGTAWRSAATESLTTDMQTQVDMAHECIKICEPNHIVMTYGTAYHSAPDGQDWDMVLTKQMANDYPMKLKTCKIGGEEWIDVNGFIINMKHFTGRSTIPHGRATPIAKDRLWNVLWAERNQCERADVIIRSHVHYFFYCGEYDWLALTTPALVGLGSKYGSRVPSETIDFGIVYFDVLSDEDWTWGWDTILGETQRTTPLSL